MFTIKNFEDNGNAKITEQLGAFKVAEFQRDLSVVLCSVFVAVALYVVDSVTIPLFYNCLIAFFPSKDDFFSVVELPTGSNITITEKKSIGNTWVLEKSNGNLNTLHDEIRC